MRYAKTKMPTQYFYHYCGRGEDVCLDIPQLAPPVEGFILYPVAWLKEINVYDEMVRRGLIVDEIDSEDMDEEQATTLDIMWANTGSGTDFRGVH